MPLLRLSRNHRCCENRGSQTRRVGAPGGLSDLPGRLLGPNAPRQSNVHRLSSVIPRKRGVREEAMIRLGVGVITAFFMAIGAAKAQGGDEALAAFYKGRSVTIVVGSSPGGGYDLYARLLGRFMSRHIPGNPTIVVQNMPGAASNIAAAHVYNVAPKDGTVIGALFMGAVVDPLFGDVRRATHDMSKFNYIGNANSDAYVCLVRTDAPVKTMADAFENELIMGASAEGASTRDFPVLLRNLLGAKFKVVAGYPGTREINLALEKGEVQGACGETWSSVAATYPSWFANNLVKPLVQESNTGYPALDRMGVPLARTFAKTDEQRQILDLIYSQTTFGRPYVVAPGVPPQRTAMLRKAFMDTMKDPDLVAEAARMKVDIGAIAGEELQALIAKLYATPPELVEKAKAAIKFGK
ncbi:MAG: tripartite tricarboxylate transporter substrate-binding protein [Beijerinckiaceae bacterium]|nr:tripartite tricarboxylate transporter substrate-binding protein [Beijerinckiaceae bacterium]